MDNPVIEIHDEEIDVEEIMRTIRENIRRRKEAGLLPDDPELVSSSSCQIPGNHSSNICDLSYLTDNYDIQNNSYFISSHRPYIGKYLIKGRNLVHEEICRYIDPVIWKQTEFNRCTASALNAINNRLNDIETVKTRLNELDIIKTRLDELNSIENKLDELDTIKTRLDELDSIDNKLNELDTIKTRLDELDSIDNKLNELNTIKTRLDELNSIDNRLNELNTIKTRLDELNSIDNKLNELETVKNRLNKLESSLLAIDADIENKTWLVQALERRISSPKAFESERDPTSVTTDAGINYFVFEDRFRGTRTQIKERQRAFLKYFEGCRNVLDIGSGRGEFLELMKEQEIVARGVDMDETMVDYCRMRGFDVDLNDAISYLEGLEDASLDGIFIDQVVEHLQPGYLIQLLTLCHQKMRYGFYLIAETVNPLSFFSLANFYIDLTHVRPVHPETLRFLFDNAGFRELEVNFLSPVNEETRLQKMPSGEGMDNKEQDQIEVYNRNVEMLNGILYGAQDYSVVGKK